MAKNAKKQPTVDATADELLAQLGAQPKVDVLGILSESGVSGGWSQGDTLHSLFFCFASWRIAGSELHKDQLVVRRLVSKKVFDRELKKLRERILPNTVTRIRARVAEHSVWDRADALLEKVIGEDTSDRQMNAELKRLQKPVRFKDEDFGRFTLDRSINWFRTRTSWNGRKVQLSLAAQEPKEVEKALKVARTLWSAPKKWQKIVDAGAVKDLLPLKHTNWRGDEEGLLSATEFAARMELISITVCPDGEFRFWHDDGDLFFGHNIEVVGTLQKGIWYAGVHG
jgi:hypothetical protein